MVSNSCEKGKMLPAEYDDSSDEDSNDEDGENAAPEMVDCASRCEEVCRNLLKDSETLGVDIEGVSLGRKGEICIVQVAHANGKVILFDITTMGSAAFTRGLKEIFETENVAKLFYDCRSDADALFHLHGITPANVLDMQVLCAKARGGKNPYLQGFSKALEAVLPYLERQIMKGIKLAGAAQFAPERGGTLEVWKKRPMPDVLKKYCALDVVHLFTLWNRWSECLPTPTLRSMSEERMRARINMDHLESGPHLARRDFEFPIESLLPVDGGREEQESQPASKRPRLTTNAYQQQV